MMQLGFLGVPSAFNSCLSELHYNASHGSLLQTSGRWGKAEALDFFVYRFPSWLVAMV